MTSNGTAILIRDSKYLRDPNNDPAYQPIIALTITQWRDFLDLVAGRSAEVTALAIAVHGDGAATLATADGKTLAYTPAEWDAFRLGVIDGEFDDLEESAELLEQSAR